MANISTKIVVLADARFLSRLRSVTLLFVMFICCFSNAGAAKDYLAPRSIDHDDHFLKDIQFRLITDPHRALDQESVIDMFERNQADNLTSDWLLTLPKDTRYWLLMDSQSLAVNELAGNLLEVRHPYPMMNRVELIIMHNDTETLRSVSGNAIPIEERQVQSRHVIFKLPSTLHANDQIILKIDSEATQRLRFRVLSVTEYAKNAAREEIFWGVFFGIIALSVLYNLLIFFAVSNVSYLYYVGYMTAVFFAQFALSSHGLAYLWSGNVTLNYNLPIFFIGFSSIFGLLFTRHFLNIPSISKALNHLISLLLIPSFAIIVLSRLLKFETLSIISDILLVALTLTTISAGYLSLKKGVPEARYFLLAWGSMLVSMLVYILSIRNVLPVNTFTVFSPQLGTVLDLSFLSLAIAEQIRQTRLQKEATLKDHQQTIKALHKAENKLVRRALYDALTGLPNRAAFDDQLEKALAKQQKIICIILKIKGMRGINQTIGHHIGDRVLKEIALRIDQEVGLSAKDQAINILEKNSQRVAALGGIKCGFILQSESDEQALQTVNTLINNLPKDYQIDRYAVNLSVCAGMAYAFVHGNNSEELFRNALIALEHADKTATGVVTYSDSINHYSERLLFLTGELQQAIANDEMDIYFQPQLDLKTNTIKGAEALARWQHPQQGFISPIEFVTIAEESGKIKQLTRWVIRKTLSYLQQCHEQGFKISVSVNVSAKNIMEPDLTDFILDQLYQHRIPACYLTLELTETMSMDDPQHTLELFKRWHHMGLSIAIDDFGTGYSSLAYLKQLPVDEIKIDRAFIKNIDSDDGDMAIVKSIIDISHNMKLKVVAEGVENEESAELVRNLQCDFIQGYWFARPMPFDDFLQKLQKHRKQQGPKPHIVYDASRDDKTN